jgi:outer membrane protein assembly factor BamB
MIVRIFRAVICWAPLLAAAQVASAQDWPQWRGPNRDGVVADAKPRSTWPEGLQQSWQIEVGIGHSSPVVSGDRVFIFSRQEEQEVVRALKLADSTEIWRGSYAAPYELNPLAAGHGKGPKSTPVVADGRLFTLGIGGILSCWNADNGALLWRRKFSQRFKHTAPVYGTAMSPLVDGGKLIVHLGGNDQGELMALNAETGDAEWSWDGDGPSYASPVVATWAGTRQVIAQTQSACVGVDLEDGKLLWKIQFKTDYDQNAVTPVIAGESIICSGYNKGINRFRLEKDGDEWHTDEVWENKEVSLYMSSPVANGERLYGFSHRQKGQLFAIDITTGQTLWTSDGRLADNASLVRTGNVIWALTTNGELIVFRDNSKQFEPLVRYKVADTPTWAHPVILPGSLLIKDETRLTRWKIPSPPAANTAAPERAKLTGSKSG